ncbi:MAG: YcbK family protein [Hyphomicrobiales bacterium]|nr:YcbK family protein [Hyphomicrobiales bacterium]
MSRFRGLGALARVAAALALFFLVVQRTETATADGGTRSLTLWNPHTNESGTFVFKRDGRYDQAELDKLNWFLRDWRINESIRMAPQLFDVVWEVYRESGATQPIEVLSGYRSPQTNAALRRHSRLVAKHSQHILGHAMDSHIPGVSMERVREIGLRLQMGGVGYYPSASPVFVHLDVGSVRYWPRMSYADLMRVFPDGKAAFVAADGRPMPGYQRAVAEIEKRGGHAFFGSLGGADTAQSGSGNIFQALFGKFGNGGDAGDDAEAQMSVAQAHDGGARDFLSHQKPIFASAAPAASAPTSPPAATAPLPGATPSATLLASLSPAPPMPPDRPTDLASADMPPMPPARPTDGLTADAAIAALVAPSPGKAQGLVPDQPPPPPVALAYAASAAISEPARSARAPKLRPGLSPAELALRARFATTRTSVPAKPAAATVPFVAVAAQSDGLGGAIPGLRRLAGLDAIYPPAPTTDAAR